MRAAIIATSAITRFQGIKDSAGNYNHYDANGIKYVHGALRFYGIAITSRNVDLFPIPFATSFYPMIFTSLSNLKSPSLACR